MRKKDLSLKDKEDFLERISGRLNAEKCVLFAYVFGSFLSGDGFQDVDIGIYAHEAQLDQSPLDFELRIEREMEEVLRVPVDVRVINNAPLSFVYNILRHKIVVADREELLRADFEGATYKKYFDFRHLRREYVRELVNAPV
jgi:predicted nucleotidyltransferase